jgi:mannose-6-phosphate isomerase-like protein (cupin superfamily)
MIESVSPKSWRSSLTTWKPRTVAQLNNFDIMVVKGQGQFVWHTHDQTDDFFLVLSGRLHIRLRDRTVVLGPGELFVVPRGAEHPAVCGTGDD